MVARALHLLSSSFRVVSSVLDKSEILLRIENTLQNKNTPQNKKHTPELTILPRIENISRK